MYSIWNTFYRRSRGLVGKPVTSQTVAAILRECSRTHDDVAKPKCTQYNSKHRILLVGYFGKQASTNFLKQKASVNSG